MAQEVTGSVDPYTSLLPAIVRSWLEQPEAETARSLNATVLSADISGFTKLGEQLAHRGPRQAGEALNDAISRCFEPMIDAAMDLGGDILKFGGDALFTLFDDDGGHAESATVRACRAAALMQQALAKVDVGTGAPLSMTVGIATGSIELLLPASGRRHVLVHGPAVDVCLGLEADAEPGEVLVDPVTSAAVPADWVDDTDPEAALLIVDRAAGDADASDRPKPDLVVDHGAGGVLTEQQRAAIGTGLAAAVDAFDGTAGELRSVVMSFIRFDTVDMDGDAVLAVMTRLDELCQRFGPTVLEIDVVRHGLKIFMTAGAPISAGDDEDALLATVTQLVGDPAMPPMQAAINRGVVYVGFLGSARCRTFTTMGDATNLTARLMNKAEPRSIIVTKAVLDNARTSYRSVELPPMLVRGRLQPVTAHRLDTGLIRPSDRRSKPPFVGRRAEVDRLRELMAAARGGQGRLVEVRGEAGVGSSRLIQELVDRSPSNTLLFKADAWLAASVEPFGALRPLLQAVAGIDDQPADNAADQADEEQAIGRRLADWVERIEPERLPMLPLLAVAFGAKVDPTDEATAVAPEFRQSIGNDVITSLMGRALTVPTIIVVENVQWLDGPSRQLLEVLARRCGDHPWLIVTSSRPTAERLSPDSDLVELTPLPGNEVEDIVAAVSDLPDDRRREMAERSGGNPLFAMELAWATDLGAERPDSIESLITSRIDRLGHDARVLVRAGAVLGPRFEIAMLNQILGRDTTAELSELDRLIELTPGDGDKDGTASFRSEVIQEVAYHGLSTRRRRELHHSVAAALEQRDDTEVADLAHHHAEADNHAQAWHYGQLAGAEAADQGLLGVAFRRLRRAVAALDRSGLDEERLGATLVELFELGIAAGERGEAVGFGQRAAELLTDPVDRARVVGYVAAETAAFDGSYQSQADNLRSALAELGTGDDMSGARAWIGSQLAGILFRTTGWDEAFEVAEAAIADADRAGLAAPKASALDIHYIVLANRADPRRVAERQAVIEAAERAAIDRAVIRAHNNVGADLERSGQWTDAIAHYDLAATGAERQGDVNLKLIPDMNRAVLLGQQGHWDDARSILDTVRREARHQHDRFIEARSQLELGKMAVAAGDLDDARRWLEACRPFLTEADNRTVIHELDILDMAADLAEGQADSVLAAAAKLDIPPDRASDLIGRPEELRAYAHMQRAENEQALAAAEEAVELVVEDNRFGLARALLARSEAEAFLGRGRSARRTRQAAQEILDELDVVSLPTIPLPK